MDRNSREVAAFVRFGFASLSLERAALSYEASCEALFDMVPARDSGTVVCPGCGGASWLPLSTIVPSLRFVPPRLAVVAAVPAVARVRA
jgi:hypothetical protein